MLTGLQLAMSPAMMPVKPKNSMGTQPTPNFALNELPRPGHPNFIGPLPKKPKVGEREIGSNARHHLSNFDGFQRGRGIQGAHNMNNFNIELRGRGGQEVSRTPHSRISGIYQIEYRLPVKDHTGQPVQPLQFRPSSPFVKTVFDPKKISDEQMFRWGQEAMRNSRIDSTNPRRVIGEASNGLRFHGWLDENGNITNFHPIID